MGELVVTNPYSGETVCRIPFDTAATIDEKLARAAAVSAQWRLLPLDERIAHVAASLERIRRDADAIATDVTRQMGKPITESRGELQTLLARGRQSMEDAPAALADDILPQEDGFRRRIVHEPLGVVLDIAAWNYPLLIPINVIVPALLAGNVVVLKHSGRTPLTGAALARYFSPDDFPGLVTSVIIDHEHTAALIRDPRVDHVSFTGSSRGGREIYRTVAERFIDCGLELGGKDSAYLAEDADVDFAAANVVEGACYNAGQSCCAVERAYVHESIYDAFLEKAAIVMAGYRIGDPRKEETTLGPLADPAALEYLGSQIDDAVARGARIILGAGRKSVPPGFFPPTLIADVHTDPHNNRVLEVGVGSAHLAVIAVDTGETPTVFVGPIYSYYEFTHPVSQRLTDAEWTKVLASGKAPSRPT